jgi:hypothetical protein
MRSNPPNDVEWLVIGTNELGNTLNFIEFPLDSPPCLALKRALSQRAAVKKHRILWTSQFIPPLASG